MITAATKNCWDNLAVCKENQFSRLPFKKTLAMMHRSETQSHETSASEI